MTEESSNQKSKKSQQFCAIQRFQNKKFATASNSSSRKTFFSARQT